MNKKVTVLIKNVRVSPEAVPNDGRGRVTVSAVVFTTADGAAIESVVVDLSCWKPELRSPMAFQRNEGIEATQEGIYSCAFEVPLLADPGATDLTIVATDSLGSTGTAQARVLVIYRRPAYLGGILRPAHQQILDRQGRATLLGGNRVEALDGGNKAFERRMALIRQARRQINLQTYSLAAEGRCGRLMEAILEKAAQGVEVNLLLNLGSQLAISPLTPLRIGLEKVGRELQGLLREVDQAFEARRGFWNMLKSMQEIFQRPGNPSRGLRVVLVDDQAILGPDKKGADRGARSQKWLKKMASDRKELDRVGSRSPSEWLLNLIGPDTLAVLPLVSYAVHEKILVVDGRQAIVGGRNLEDRYFTHWVDKDLHLEGPIVRDVQLGFLRSWEAFCRNGKRDGSALRCLEESEPAGRIEARFTQSRPWMGEYHVLEKVVTAIQMARKRICITSQYLALPESLLRNALIEAASRGVEVHILTNSHTTGQEIGFGTGYLVSLNHCAPLLDAGVRIYEMKGFREDGMPNPYLHSKEFLVDGEWASIGSFNLSLRSCYIEAENLVDVQDPAFVREQETAFWERVRKDAQEMTSDYLKEQKARFGGRLALARYLELFH
ncbi:MAG: phosphatidylserine/phosphatidylglycerophosphate/cardiolipin synthase family protein [bacterium]